MGNDELNPYRSPESIREPSPPPGSPERLDEWEPGDVDDPVPVASYLYLPEAEMLRLMLEQHGIRTVLADSAAVGLYWFASNALGGIKLLVARKDAPRAAALLEEQKAAQARTVNESPITFRCDECNAEITFPGHRRGKTETCPECREYVDVPE